MPRQPTRFRRVILGVTLALLAVVVGTWGTSYLEARCLRWRHEDIVQAGANFPDADDSRRIGRQYEASDGPGYFMLSRSAWELPYGSPRPVWVERRENGWYFTSIPYKFGSAPFIGSVLPPSAIGWEAIRLGFHRSSTPSRRLIHVTVPYWLPVPALLGAAFWLWYPPHRTAKRLANNQCPKCGYDRKGLAPGASCPECGEVPAPTPPAA